MNDKSLVFALTAFLLPLSALSGTLVDDFNDGDLTGWRMYENFWMNKIVVMDSGNWVVENGTVIGGDDNPGRTYYLMIGDMSWMDYIAEVSVKLSKILEKCQMNTGIWLAIRLQLDDGKFGLNDYFIGILNDDGINVFRGGCRYVAGGFFNIQMFPTKTESNVWYRLMMTAEGDHITGFIDDMKVYDLIDGSFTSGAVAIAVNGVRAAFDDFMVTGPEIPDIQLGRPVKASGKLATTWGSIRISN